MRKQQQRERVGVPGHCAHTLQIHNPNWQEVIWDAKAVRALIEQDFPWFLPTYLSYPKLVQRSDVTRYMVLYKYGGVYLDADVSVSGYGSMQYIALLFCSTCCWCKPAVVWDTGYSSQ